MTVKIKVLTKSNLDINNLFAHVNHINDVDPHGSSRFIAKDGSHNYIFDVKGSGFNYIGDIPIGGTVSRIIIDKGSKGQLQIELSPKLDLDKALKASSLEKYLEKQVIKMTGNNGNDKFESGDKNDTLRGERGNDTLKADSGNDKVWGGRGNDKLYGEQGADVITGDEGRDDLYGGNGPDRFDFNKLADSVVGSQRDTIRDFNEAQGDRIDLRTIDADTITGGDQAFTFVAAFTGVAGQLQQVGNLVQGDVNGDSVADFEIRVLNTVFSGDEFLL